VENKRIFYFSGLPQSIYIYAHRRASNHLALPSSLVFLQGGVARLSFTARIGRAPFHRARSASKKDGLAAPFSLFAKAWKRFVKPGAPGPLSLEALVALKMADSSAIPLRR